MNLEFTFKHMKSSEHIKEYTTEKSDKLKKYFQGRLHLVWSFTTSGKEGHIAHCHLLGDHMDYFVESTEDNMYAAIDHCVSRLERQVRKHKEIVKDKIHRERNIA